MKTHRGFVVDGGTLSCIYKSYGDIQVVVVPGVVNYSHFDHEFSIEVQDIVSGETLYQTKRIVPRFDMIMSYSSCNYINAMDPILDEAMMALFMAIFMAIFMAMMEKFV